MKKQRPKKDCQDEKQTLQSVLNQIPLIHQSLSLHQNKKTTIKLLVQVTPTRKSEK
jgi:hypothetical protein